MSDQTDPNGQTGQEGAPAGNGGAEDPLTKLQAEMSKVGAAEHAKGVTAGKRALLAELGFSSKEEAMAAITGWRATGTTATELEQKYQAAETRASQAEARARQLGLQFDASAALVAAGVRADRVAPSLQLILASIAGEPETPSAERVTAIVGAFKEQTPEFFSDATPPPGTDQDPSLRPGVPGPAGPPGGAGANGGRTGGDPAAIADAEFEARFAKQLQNKPQPIVQ